MIILHGSENLHYDVLSEAEVSLILGQLLLSLNYRLNIPIAPCSQSFMQQLIVTDNQTINICRPMPYYYNYYFYYCVITLQVQDAIEERDGYLVAVSPVINSFQFNPTAGYLEWTGLDSIKYLLSVYFLAVLDGGARHHCPRADPGSFEPGTHRLIGSALIN